MPRKTPAKMLLRRSTAVPQKKRVAPKKQKASWLMAFVGVMPDLGDPIAIQKELRRERR
jgi:hypothetical protein